MIKKIEYTESNSKIINKINEIIDSLNNTDKIIYCPECMKEDLLVKLVDDKCPQCNREYNQ